MKNVLLYQVKKAVEMSNDASAIRAASVEAVPPVAKGRRRGTDGAGLDRRAFVMRKLPDPMGPGSLFFDPAACCAGSTVMILGRELRT